MCQKVMAMERVSIITCIETKIRSRMKKEEVDVGRYESIFEHLENIADE